MAAVLRDLDRLEEAEVLFNEMATLWAEWNPQNPALPSDWQFRYGECLLKMNRYEEAEALLVDSYERWEPYVEELADRVSLSHRLARLVELYDAWDKPEMAAEYRALRTPPLARHRTTHRHPRESR